MSPRRHCGSTNVAAGLGLLALTVLAASTTMGTTYAAWSDFEVIADNRVGAGVWAPDPPAICGKLETYLDGIIYGTEGDDTIYGGNQGQIIMGLGGNDIIYGKNSGDCLVGGAGNDRLYGGNGKDILLGGDGDDLLDGGNAPDYLDAGGSAGDVCDGGNGRDQAMNCGGPAPALLPTPTAPEPQTVLEVQLAPLSTQDRPQAEMTSTSANTAPVAPTRDASPLGMTATDGGDSIEEPLVAPVIGAPVAEEQG